MSAKTRVFGPLRPAARDVVIRTACGVACGLVVGCTLAARPVPAVDGPLQSALLGIFVGAGVVLTIFPWRSLLDLHRLERDLADVAERLHRAADPKRTETLRELLPDRTDALAPMVEGAREVVIRSQNHRRERTMIERTLDHSIQRATETATRRLRAEAETDPLTGLGNRRALNAVLASCFDGSYGAEETIAALIIDLDHFKQVNDRLGHDAGDRCLTYLGDLLNSSVRGDDCVARLGGDEFVVVMPGADGEAARGLAERLRVAFQQIAWSHANVRRPTLSIGVGVVSAGDRAGASLLLRRADAALYSVKRAGRDGVAA